MEWDWQHWVALLVWTWVWDNWVRYIWHDVWEWAKGWWH